MNEEDLSPQRIVDYAVTSPLVEKAETLVTPYIDQMSDDEFEEAILNVVKNMKLYPNLTEEKIAEVLAEQWEVPEVVEKLQGKIPAKREFEYQQTDESHLESFDDLESF